MTFVSTQQVRFAHVDAAGIVFYPRYFEMLNASIEDYFERQVGASFAQMHAVRRIGVPTVRLETDFVAPSRLGDRLDFHLSVDRVGRSSLEASVEVRCGDALRCRMRVVIVCMALDIGRAIAWPEDMRPVEDASVA